MKSFSITLILFTILHSAIAQSPVENKKTVTAAFDKWAKGAGSFFDLLTEDVRWTITGSTSLSKTYHSKAEFLEQVIDPLNNRLAKKIVPSVRGLYAEGDVVIALIDGKATAKDGKPYNMSYAWFMHMKNGRIYQVDAFLDGIQFESIMQRLRD